LEITRIKSYGKWMAEDLWCDELIWYWDDIFNGNRPWEAAAVVAFESGRAIHYRPKY
jgi:hypothetical protein